MIIDEGFRFYKLNISVRHNSKAVEFPFVFLRTMCICFMLCHKLLNEETRKNNHATSIDYENYSKKLSR